MDKAQQHKILRVAATGCFLIALALRLLLFYRSLQYDELWSWQYFSDLNIKDIFFDLSLPNNHPLNTLAIKLAAALSDDLFSIRVLPLICGMLLMIPVGFATYVWSKDKIAGFYAAVLTAFSVPLTVYSVLARGYIFQAFFFALTAAGFACFSDDLSKKYSIVGFFLIVTGGIGTILSVPTGVVFLAALAAAIFARYRTWKVHKALAASLVFGVILTAIYYTKTSQALVSAQKWSVGGSYFINSGRILLHTACGTIIAVITAIRLFPGKSLPLLIIPLIVLLSGAVTGLGPDRTYIIFTMLFCAVCAMVISELLKRNISSKIFAGLLIALFAAGQIFLIPKYLLPDWKMAETKKEMNTITVYSATSTYPLLWNKGSDFVADYQAAVENIYLKKIKVFAPNGVFNGMDNSFSEKQIQTGLTGIRGYDKVLGEYHCYNLELCTEPKADACGYLVVFPLSSLPIVPPEDSLRINPHLEAAHDRSKRRCGVYFTSKYPSDVVGGNIFLIR